MTGRDPLVLVPGHMTDGRIWRHQVAALSDRADVQIAGLGEHETLAEIAADILAAAPPLFALAGFSFGGYVALELMRQAPERVIRLALLGTSARADTPEQAARRKSNIASARNGGLSELTDQFLSRLGGPVTARQPALMDEIDAMVRSLPLSTYVSQQSAMLHRVDSRLTLSEIHCPTAVICGSGDVLLPPEHSLEITAGIPNAVFVPAFDAGHMCMLEQPAAVSSLLYYWMQC
jgi:pimeloyl-ACP methyl ester carboxylesterase